MPNADPVYRLIQLRKQLGLSQRDMAAELGVTPGALAMWERNSRPVPETVIKIIEIYEESLDEELARRNHEEMIRKLSSSWANRLVVVFGKGARQSKRSEIESKMEVALSSALRHELSLDRVKRNIQIAVFNRIVRAASQTKGLPMKVVQLMTYINPSMPIEARRVLEDIYKLQFPLAPTVVSKIVAESLGASPTKLFAEWSPTPFAAASIGQVHLARLKTGERVAVKVQYPDIQASLKSDVKALGFVAEMSTLFNREIRGVIDEIKQVVLDETDYFKEMDSLETFSELFKGDQKIIIPKVYRNFSESNIITMDYIEGQSLSEFKQAPYEDRKAAAETVARFTTISSFKSGLLNTDGNPGNFIFGGGGRVGFIDFGRTATIDLEGSFAQVDLLKSVIRNDKELARRTIPHLPIIRDVDTFPFDEFWDFFTTQQAHFQSPSFRFTNDYVAKTLKAAENSRIRKDLKPTIELVMSTAVSIGVWNILTELDVEVNYGKVSLDALEEVN